MALMVHHDPPALRRWGWGEATAEIATDSRSQSTCFEGWIGFLATVSMNAS